MRTRFASDAQHDHHGEGDQRHAGEHGETDADHRLDLAVNAQALDDTPQGDGNDDCLEDEGDGSRHVEMRGILDVCLPGNRERQGQRVQRIDMEERVEPVLVEQHETYQDEAAGQQMRNVEIETVHLEAPGDEAKECCQKPQHQGSAQELGHPEDPHLGDRGLEQGKKDGAKRELGEIAAPCP